MISIRKLASNQMVRFMAVNGFSTMVMFGLYVVLNMVMKYQIAYFIAYVFTVILSYVLTSLFVFKTKMSWQTFMQFPLIYVLQYATSAICLEILVRLGFSVTYVPLFVIVLLLPLTFLLSRYVMLKR